MPRETRWWNASCAIRTKQWTREGSPRGIGSKVCVSLRENQPQRWSYGSREDRSEKIREKNGIRRVTLRAGTKLVSFRLSGDRSCHFETLSGLCSSTRVVFVKYSRTYSLEPARSTISLGHRTNLVHFYRRSILTRESNRTVVRTVRDSIRSQLG